MSSVSLLSVGWRNIDALIHQEKELRISCFHTPSSLYVQLIDEDSLYAQLEIDMFDYYSIAPLYFYCSETNTLQTERTSETLIQKLHKKDLRSKMMVAMFIQTRWARCIIKDDPRIVQDMDTGDHYDLGAGNETPAIYELEHNFLLLPPRAILCGLADLTPSENHCWSETACRLFISVTKNHKSRGYFARKGFLPNSAYLSLMSIGENGSIIHVNMILVAFNVAMQNYSGFQQPIYTRDKPLSNIGSLKTVE